MATMELLFNLLDINLSIFKKNEKMLIEYYFFTCFCKELLTIFYSSRKEYLDAAKFYTEKEDTMIDIDFLLFLINDILSTEEYSLAGIANHIHVPEEVIYDLFYGLHKNPSLTLWKKVIELHSTVRQDLYRSLIKKIIPHSS